MANMRWLNKIGLGKSSTNPYVKTQLQAIPGASLNTPRTGPQPIVNKSSPDSLLNVARYAKALRIGGTWWDLLDNYHMTTGYSIYDYPE